jgi:tetratricopeptide (TPR) repeat protein
MIARSSGVLLERDAELEAVTAAVAAARGGAGALLHIEGAAGIGKTGVLAAARELATEEGMFALTARAGELEDGFAWGVVRQLFEPALAARDARGREELLAGAAALAAPVLGPVADGMGEEAPFSVLHGLYWLTVNLAQRAALVICVDDLHWADAPSLRFLAYLAPRLEGLPVLLVTTARRQLHDTSAFGRLGASVFGGLAARVLRPGGLSESGCGQLVRELLVADASSELCRYCHHLSKGNPFLVHELIDELASGDAPADAWTVEHLAGMGDEVVLRSVLLKLARLPVQALPLARAVAVLGPHASLRRASVLAELDSDAATATADQLIAAGVLEDTEPPGFIHPLVRSSVYGDLGISERSRWHKRAARLLAREDLPVEQLVGHLLACRADSDPWVVDSLRAAAAVARRCGAPEVAVACLARALAEPPGPEERAEVLLELGLAEAASEPVASVEHLAEALERNRDPTRRGFISLALGQATAFSGRFVAAADILETALTEAGEETSPLLGSLQGEFLNAARFDLMSRPRAFPLLARVEQRALSGEPLDPRLYANLATELAARGQERERAVAFSHQALSGGVLARGEDTASFPVATNALPLATTTLPVRGRSTSRAGVPD